MVLRVYAMNEVKQFDIEFKNDLLRVTRHLIKDQEVYRISFSDQRKPLVITQASIGKNMRFWTSLPQGRQQEAEQIGTVIEQYLNS